jgi:hypothetical protein
VIVTLRPLAPADASCIDAWLPAAARSVGYESDSCASLLARAKGERTFRVRAITREEDDVGLVVYSLNTPRRGSALFELVATPPEHTRRGDGMIAAALVEEEMRAANVRIVYAPAPAMHGISMYFWIRLGYAPLFRGEWPCHREGIAWLRRQL